MTQPLLAEKKKKEKKSQGRKEEQRGKNWKGGWKQPANKFSQVLERSRCLSSASLSLSSSRKELHTLHWFPSSSCIVRCPCALGPDSMVYPSSWILSAHALLKGLHLLPSPSLEQPHVPRCPGFHFIHTFAQVSSVWISLSETAVSRRISFFPLPSPFLTFTFSWNMSFRLFVLSVNFMTKMCLHPQLLRLGLKGGPVILQT